MAKAPMVDGVREAAAGEALRVAYRFLGRWQDGFTRNGREELAHEAAILALERRHTLRDSDKFAAFVRTIARRMRSHAAREAERRAQLSIDRGDVVREELTQPRREPVRMRVSDVLVDRDVLLAHLGPMLESLTCLNRSIVLSYYEGFSCAELAARFRIPEESVKVRVHRARGRLRQLFERRVCSLTGEFRTDS